MATHEATAAGEAAALVDQKHENGQHLLGEIHQLIRDAKIGKFKHFSAAKRKAHWDVLLGGAGCVGAVMVTTMLVVRLALIDTAATLTLITICISGLVSALTIAHLFLQPRAEATRHHDVGVAYLDVARRAHVVRSKWFEGVCDMSQLAEAVDNLTNQYVDVSRESAALPTSSRDYRVALSKYSIDNPST